MERTVVDLDGPHADFLADLYAPSGISYGHDDLGEFAPDTMLAAADIMPERVAAIAEMVGCSAVIHG
jgi:hypothetical protein